MIIFNDIGNTNSLKIISAAFVGQLDVNVESRKPEDKVVSYLPYLPVLEYDAGCFLFSSNESCRFVLRKSGKDVEDLKIDEYLEFEAATLQPLLHHTLSSLYNNGRVEEVVTHALNKCLKKLDSDIGSHHFFVSNMLSAADLVLWCTLYPILSECSPIEDYRKKVPHLATWFSILASKKEFQAAVQKINNSNLIDEFKQSILSRPTPLLPVELSSKVAISDPLLNSAHTISRTMPSSSSLASTSHQTPLTKEEIKRITTSWNNGIKSRPKPKERIHPVLPKDGERNILITSALPYVNNVPHLGNIIGCVLSADVYSRFCQLCNHNCLYLCGTDEYGTATETKAVEEGLSPQEICDKYNKLHIEIYNWFNIGFDYFGRTTTQEQTKIAQDIFWKLHKNGYILKDSIEQLLCGYCNRFLADRFVEGTCPFCAYEDARGDQCDKCGKLINAIELKNPRCKLCSRPPIVKSSSHLFMDLPGLEPLLQNHLDKAFKEGMWTSNAKQITNSWIRDGLKARCITRDLKWGTPVPLEGYTDKVFYVWYDAPIGYISITANYTKEWEQWWKNPKNVELINFMAKDNVPFHSVIFPSSQLGTGDDWTVVNHLCATEYLNYEDGKFSKSRGIGVFGNNAKDTGIPADIWRFYLLYVRPETQDSAFSWDDFMTKNNSELLNNLGNFINRALMFVASQFKGTIPTMELGPNDVELLALVARELKNFVDNLEKVRLRDGIRNILSISRLGNQYIQASKPWIKIKGTEKERVEAGTVIGVAANTACLLSVMVQPYMPEVATTIQTQLRAPKACNVLTEELTCLLAPGHKIGKPSPLFQKLELKQMEVLKMRFAGKQTAGFSKAKEGLRGQQATVTESTVVTGKASQGELEKLVSDVTTQGNRVRQLKSNNTEKSIVDAEVGTLLELKKKLAEAQCEDPSVIVGGGSEKRKNSNK